MEGLSIELVPGIHVAAPDVVRQVVEIIESDAKRVWIDFADPVEISTVGRALGAIGVDEIEQRAAGPNHGRHVQCLVGARVFGRTEVEGALLAMSVQNARIDAIKGTRDATIMHIMRGYCVNNFDIKILRALQEDGRLTNNDLAEKVGLSPSQCSRRRAALEEGGVIASYHALLSPEALGLDVLAFVNVTLATHSTDNAQRFLALVESLDEVQEAYSLTGESDYLVKRSVPTLKCFPR